MISLRVLVAATLLLSLGGTPAGACSCIRLPGGELLAPARVEIPANAPGLPWFGHLSGAVPAGAFSVHLLDRKEKVPVEVRFEVVRTGPIPVTDGDGSLVLISPAGGFRPGASYQIEYRRPRFDHPGALEEAPQRVRVTVAREPLVLQGRQAELKAEDRGSNPLDVVTLIGSCSTRVLVHQVGLELRLPASLARWKKSLLFATVVDGSPWQPTSALCSRVPPGRSWARLGSDLAFTACGIDPASLADLELEPDELSFLTETMGSPEFSLAQGDHQVEMIGWLPGTDVVLRASARIRLACPAVEGTPASPRTKS